jgi:hypothetical protein
MKAICLVKKAAYVKIHTKKRECIDLAEKIQ